MLNVCGESKIEHPRPNLVWLRKHKENAHEGTFRDSGVGYEAHLTAPQLSFRWRSHWSICQSLCTMFMSRKSRIPQVWLIGVLVDRNLDWATFSFIDTLIDWLIDWLTGWLDDWLIDWLIDVGITSFVWLKFWLTFSLIDSSSVRGSLCSDQLSANHRSQCHRQHDVCCRVYSRRCLL